MTDLFATPYSVDRPSDLFPHRDDHPVQRIGITGMDGEPVPTNRFYSNLYLSTRRQGVWPLPYMLWVTFDQSGLSISHTDANQLTFGPDPNRVPVQYYISPLGIRSLSLGAQELVPSSPVTTTKCTAFSVQLDITVSPRQRLSYPIVQGMGFVTARYENLTPVLDSVVTVRHINPAQAPRGGLQKWRVTLNDGKSWLIYACPDLSKGAHQLELRKERNNRIGSPCIGRGWWGIIQVAKCPRQGDEGVYDDAAGAYCTGIALAGHVKNDQGWLDFKFEKVGNCKAGSLLMFALPHHVESFDEGCGRRLTGVELRSPTKGMMRGVLADVWKMHEVGLPIDIGWFGPGMQKITGKQKAEIKKVAEVEGKQDVAAQTNLDSMYFSGKAFAKFATILLVLTSVLQERVLAEDLFRRLRTAFDSFATNVQQHPLVYDRKWCGLISSASFATGNALADFGNAYYNDHHFHYGYHIFTAAILVHVEEILFNTRNWLDKHETWVTTLIRDVANPSAKDKWFPVSRSFDFFVGHSWAKGLFESADGKDQESTSEDVNFAYALKLWGLATREPVIEQRGDLMLGILRRTVNTYFLLTPSCVTHPRSFLENKVTGILFENKVDHATYFGMDPRYIQGIHMLPITPITLYIREKSFCKEEWEKYFAGGRWGDDGWKGVVWAGDLGVYDPVAAWNMFTNCEERWLDGGMSRTGVLVVLVGGGGVLSGGLWTKLLDPTTW